ncbi:g5487 [Coccomyxa viridis]|uniref:G5487 protein n=1 Tax=Coccomyxa viridis TaxID=1274662 RepID=A0ABP1FZM1_9CHLO
MPALRSCLTEVDLETLISEVQHGGLQSLVNRASAALTSYLSSVENSFARAPFASTLSVLLPKLFPLPSIVPPKGGAPATIGQPCAKGTLELPYAKGPSCSAKTITLTLVPWSCVLNGTHNILSCSDSYLLYEESPEHCSLLDASEGMLAGRQCPLKHKLGPKKDIHLGGEIFKLKAKDVLGALLAEVPNP